MKPRNPVHRWLTLCVFVCLCGGMQSQVAPIRNTPVGHWIAEHPSKGGIGSWWEFRADGALTLHFGAMVTSTITRSGDSFLSPSGTVGGAPVKVTFKVEADTLHLSEGGADRTFTRIGVAPSATDPLLGRWRPNLPVTPSSDPNTAAMEKVQANATYFFAANGTEIVRIPFGAREGTWDAKAHSFQFKNEKIVYTYQFSGGKLLLTQPPDGKESDSYLPDPIPWTD